MKLATLTVFAWMMLFSSFANPAEDMLHFDTPEQRAFFEKLTHEFRCLKCQNQTIASSGADLAGDLRDEIHTMVLAGKNRDEITQFLVQRYGDFVLYRPRFNVTTLLLWLGPLLLLGVALRLAWSMSKSPENPESDSTQAELERARELLKD